MPADYEAPPFPEELRYLWDYYNEIRPGLEVNGMAMPSLSWVAVDAWSRQMGIYLQPPEVQALFWIDAVTRTESEKK